MTVRVKKWGNSLGVRLPKATADSVGIFEDVVLDVKSKGTSIVLTPVQPSIDLDSLFDKISESNLPEDDWGAPMGREQW